MKPWKAAALVLVVLAVAVGAYAFWPQLTGAEVENAEDRPDAERVSARARVQAVELQPTDFLILAEATGHLTPWREAGVSPEASGLVRERLVDEGTRVQEGQALLRLDSRDQELELEEASSELLRAQIDYASKRVGSNSEAPDSALLERARRAFEQAREAYEAGSLTLEEFQMARRAHDADVLRSGSRRNEVEAVLSGLEQAEQRVRRAELALSRMTVRAPFTGRIANLEVEEGQRVAVGETVLTLLDDARMKVTVNVLEADIVGLRKGAVARVRIPALGDSVLTGRIWSVNPSVDRETGTGRVTVEVPNRGGTLLSGLFAYVQLESGRLQDRMVVPAEAVLVRQGRDLVFVVKDGRAQWTYVTTGRRSGGLVEILDPLQPGDSLAVAGHHALSHDARVTVQ
ncbi:MAG: efflux RND transporter periplasmic adaptor subunit [Rhodothermales bacterium]